MNLSVTCWLCDSSYVGYTRRHLFQRINEHRYSAVGKHLRESHNLDRPITHEQFNILKECRGKLIYETLLIKERRPTLNTQADSIRAKLFI